MKDSQSKQEHIGEAEALLPWHITGRLSPEDQKVFEQESALDPSLKAVIAQEKEIHSLVKNEQTLFECLYADMTEQRLSQMLDRIDASEPSLKAQQNHHQSPSVIEKIKSWLQPNDSYTWLSPANAVFASLLAIQFALFAVWGQKETPAIYETASVDSPMIQAEHGRTTFLIEFTQDARIGAINDFLRSIDARVVSGPNTQDTYVVDVPKIDQIDRESYAKAVLQKASESNAPVLFFGPKFQQP